jgi:microcystin-dependent protein
MADPFVAEIRIFGFNFPPTGWASCDGQIMPIRQNTALFSLLGTVYGGDGKNTFALPDLQGSAPMHPGQGPGLSLRDLGERGGADTVTLDQTMIPSHVHTVQASNVAGNRTRPAANCFARASAGAVYGPAPPGNVQMSPQMTTPTGGDAPHNNLMPYLVANFCIATQGVFPARP